jgi:hypothetical protein
MCFYLSFTSLSQFGLRGRLFIMSASDISYAKEIAGIYTQLYKIQLNTVGTDVVIWIVFQYIRT